MGSAPSALLYLCSRSVLNLVLVRLRRLKQPKYLFGALLALAYLYFAFIFPHVTRAARRAERIAAGEAVPAARDLSDSVTAAAGMFMLLLFTVLWLWRRGRTSLQFSEAEIAWLFPGPISHAALVHYGLLRGQAALLLTAALMTLFTAGWNFIPSPLWARAVGWFLIFGIFTLHTTASGFVLTRLLDRGVAQWQRQLGVLLLVTLVVWLMNVLDPQLRLPLAGETSSPEAFIAYAQNQFGGSALGWLLLPLRAAAGPLVAADAIEFLQALGPALAVYALHYVWAFRSELPDREATMASAAKRATLLADMRKGNMRFSLAQPKARRDPFNLAAGGSPAVALLWKNLLSTREYLNLRTLLAIAAALIAWNVWVDTAPPGVFSRILTIVAFVLGVQTLFVGAQFARQDLRSDLDNADLIKTWPLPGWQIVLGELLAPTLILTGILWLCLLQIGLALNFPARPWLTPELRLAAFGSLALVLPFLCAMQLLIANTAAVLFPAWLKSTHQSHGWESAGPRLLFFAAQWIAMLAMLLPALLFGMLAYIPAAWFIGSFAILPAALLAAVVMAGELAWGIDWLGARFDAYDLSG